MANYLTGKLNLAPGDRAVLSFPPGPKFLVTFLACLATRVIAGMCVGGGLAVGLGKF